MSLAPTARFVIAGLLIASAGCGTGGTSTGMPHDAGTGAGGAGTGGASDAGSDSGYPSCSGFCALGPASGWDYPALVWIGNPQDAPACPEGTNLDAYEGYADLDAPTDCVTCSCAPPTGSCGLPATMTANAASCAQNGASTPHTPFDPASGWDGTCDTNESIPSGKLCSGVKCVQSLTIGLLTVANESSCTPSQQSAQSTPAWKTFARGCKAVPPVACDPANVCFPISKPPGFRVCIFQVGDSKCPSFTPYTEKHVFYDDFQDTRACADCTCGSPTGGKCTSGVSIYSDGACSTLLYSATIDSTGPACHDLPPGTPLGSKFASSTAYTAGTCQPGGGQPMGAATPINPSTYCCLPP